MLIIYCCTISLQYWFHFLVKSGECRTTSDDERVSSGETLQLSGSNGRGWRCGEPSRDVAEPVDVDVVVETSGKPLRVFFITGSGIRVRACDQISGLDPVRVPALITLVKSTGLPVLVTLV